MLQVAFPFARVGSDAVGGAEQVLTMLDAGLTRLGHRSIVVAAAGSATQGLLIPTELPSGVIDQLARDRGHAAHRDVIAAALRRHAIDIVHLHNIDFDRTLPLPGPPALITLHLPPSWYAPAALQPTRPDTWLNPVSDAQARECPAGSRMLAAIPNGVPVAAFRGDVSRRGFAIALGRICPEKNFAAALDAGTIAGVPVLLGGLAYPYPDHQCYLRDEILPRIRRGPHRFLGPLGFARKRRLLLGARCLLSASLAPETSSLVAMEALACGTPVIAFPSGALKEIVEDGITGFLVNDVAGMAAALRKVADIDPERCRAAARERFDADRMVREYVALYQRLVTPGSPLVA